MKMSRQTIFQTIKTEGGILPSDLLQSIADRHSDLPGMTEDAYHLSGIRLTEAIGQSWNRLSGSWKALKTALDKLPDTDPATSATREKWLLPLFEELRYGRLPMAKSEEIDGKTYTMSHLWGNIPFLLVGCRVDIERRSHATGSWKGSPHGLLQEYLNRSDDKLWGFVSNGYRLRVLRDNLSLTRQAYVEFDLQVMFDGECYADFVILWLLCHQSRLESQTDGTSQVSLPSHCWLEKWSQFAQDNGTRALEKLRMGVEEAINAIGGGFLAHPANQELLRQLRDGELDKQEYYRQILRVVYRLIFLFVAEDRDLLIPIDSPQQAKRRYYDYYSVSRLRTLAEKRVGSQHADLWQGLKLIFGKLAGGDGCPQLGLPPLGSFLWSHDAIFRLAQCELPNANLLKAIYCLSFVTDGKVRMSVDYRNLGAEELGGIYEALLEMHPLLDLEAGSFLLSIASGNERKTTGSYYTPTCLVNCLLDSALEPVIAERLEQVRKLSGKLCGTLARGRAPEGSENLAPLVPANNTTDGNAKKNALPSWVASVQREVAMDTPVPHPLLAEKALLSMKICDPACGSGHFLIAAAHRTAKHLASVRTGDAEPSPEATRKALRDVIGHCLFGVDINPMAVELCKVSLWVEALEPGKPLSFLDHHIKCGNSLIGTTPESIADGIPDDAYSAIEGDEKAACAALKKNNKAERKADGFDFFSHDGSVLVHPVSLATSAAIIDDIDDNSLQSLERKQEAYRKMTTSVASANAHLVADLWCAAFVWLKHLNMPRGTAAPTTATLRQAESNPESISSTLREQIQQYATQYKFFHWYLEFPSVFDSSNGGFDIILGNPPWERINLKGKEFFAERDPNIANATNAAARNILIKNLAIDNPALLQSFKDSSRQTEGESHFLHNSGVYPLCGRGDINLYAVFAELVCRIISSSGRFGAIFPSGIATDDTTKFFFQNLVETQSLVSLFDFENRLALFPGVHRSYKFCLLTGGATGLANSADFAFFALSTDELLIPEKRFTLSPEDISLLNPRTHTCPIFRWGNDAKLTQSIYRRVGIFQRNDNIASDDFWKIEIGRMFHASDDSPLFCCTESPNSLRLYEAKCYWQFDHRFASFVGNEYCDVKGDQKNDPNFLIKVHYNIEKNKIPHKFQERIAPWFLSFRNISRATDARSVVASITPKSGLLHSGNNIFIKSALDASCLLASLNSFLVDYVARQKMGGPNMSVGIISQLPVLPPSIYLQQCCWHGSEQTLRGWLLARILELTYTAWDLAPFANACGYDCVPFKWDENRRFRIRCELDAAFFNLYLPANANGDWKTAMISAGAVRNETLEEYAALTSAFPTPRDAVAYIMDTFPGVKRKDETVHGIYRTKDAILAIYDEMAQVIAENATEVAAGRQPTAQYQTRLNPPPGPPCDANGNFIPMVQWDPNNWPKHIHPPKAVDVKAIQRFQRSLQPYRDHALYRRKLVLTMLALSGDRLILDRLLSAWVALSSPEEMVRALGGTPEVNAWASRLPDRLTEEDGLQDTLWTLLDKRAVRISKDHVVERRPEDGEVGNENVEMDARYALAAADAYAAQTPQHSPIERTKYFSSEFITKLEAGVYVTA